MNRQIQSDGHPTESFSAKVPDNIWNCGGGGRCHAIIGLLPWLVFTLLDLFLTLFGHLLGAFNLALVHRVMAPLALEERGVVHKFPADTSAKVLHPVKAVPR